MAIISDGIELVRTHAPKRPVPKVRREDTAAVLLPKLGRALAKPGIPRSVVFSDPNNPKLYAYYAYIEDLTKIIRESADGTKCIGRVVRGKFVPV
jgi:hypothetical protein